MKHRLVGIGFSFGLAALLVGALTAVPALASGSGTWTTTGSLNVGRQADTVTLLQTGQVLVAGGANYSWNSYASAELYNPSTGKWTMTGSMNSPRIYATATLLPDGRVLVAGGYATTGSYGLPISLASAELYNPSTGKWTTTGSMKVGRYGHEATLLQNGQVLVVGGQTARGYYTPSAELYNPSTGTWTSSGRMNLTRYASKRRPCRTARYWSLEATRQHSPGPFSPRRSCTTPPQASGRRPAA